MSPPAVWREPESPSQAASQAEQYFKLFSAIFGKGYTELNDRLRSRSISMDQFREEVKHLFVETMLMLLTLRALSYMRDHDTPEQDFAAMKNEFFTWLEKQDSDFFTESWRADWGNPRSPTQFAKALDDQVMGAAVLQAELPDLVDEGFELARYQVEEELVAEIVADDMPDKPEKGFTLARNRWKETINKAIERFFRSDRVKNAREKGKEWLDGIRGIPSRMWSYLERRREGKKRDEALDEEFDGGSGGGAGGDGSGGSGSAGAGSGGGADGGGSGGGGRTEMPTPRDFKEAFKETRRQVREYRRSQKSFKGFWNGVYTVIRGNRERFLKQYLDFLKGEFKKKGIDGDIGKRFGTLKQRFLQSYQNAPSDAAEMIDEANLAISVIFYRLLQERVGLAEQDKEPEDRKKAVEEFLDKPDCFDDLMADIFGSRWRGLDGKKYLIRRHVLVPKPLFRSDYRHSINKYLAEQPEGVRHAGSLRDVARIFREEFAKGELKGDDKSTEELRRQVNIANGEFYYTWWAFDSEAKFKALINDQSAFPRNIGQASRPEWESQKNKVLQQLLNNSMKHGNVEGRFLGISDLTRFERPFSDTVIDTNDWERYPYIGLGVALAKLPEREDYLDGHMTREEYLRVNPENLRWKWDMIHYKDGKQFLASIKGRVLAWEKEDGSGAKKVIEKLWASEYEGSTPTYEQLVQLQGRLVPRIVNELLKAPNISVPISADEVTIYKEKSKAEWKISTFGDGWFEVPAAEFSDKIEVIAKHGSWSGIGGKAAPHVAPVAATEDEAHPETGQKRRFLVLSPKRTVEDVIIILKEEKAAEELLINPTGTSRHTKPREKPYGPDWGKADGEYFSIGKRIVPPPKEIIELGPGASANFDFTVTSKQQARYYTFLAWRGYETDFAPWEQTDMKMVGGLSSHAGGQTQFGKLTEPTTGDVKHQVSVGTAAEQEHIGTYRLITLALNPSTTEVQESLCEEVMKQLAKNGTCEHDGLLDVNYTDFLVMERVYYVTVSEPIEHERVVEITLELDQAEMSRVRENGTDMIAIGAIVRHDGEPIRIIPIPKGDHPIDQWDPVRHPIGEKLPQYLLNVNEKITFTFAAPALMGDPELEVEFHLSDVIQTASGAKAQADFRSRKTTVKIEKVEVAGTDFDKALDKSEEDLREHWGKTSDDEPLKWHTNEERRHFEDAQAVLKEAGARIASLKPDSSIGLVEPTLEALRDSYNWLQPVVDNTAAYWRAAEQGAEGAEEHIKQLEAYKKKKVLYHMLFIEGWLKKLRKS